MEYAALAVFCLLAGMIGAFANRSRQRLIPFRGHLALPGKALRLSEDAWSAGHHAAWPYLACASAIALIQALAVYASFFVTASSYTTVVSGVGLLLILLLLGMATLIANRTAQNPPQ